MKPERADILRRRPEKVRYFYLAVSNKNLHSGMSYGGLHYVKKHYDVVKLYVADLLTKQVIEVTESVEDFMKRWRMNYNNPTWDYAKDIEYAIPVPQI